MSLPVECITEYPPKYSCARCTNKNLTCEYPAEDYSSSLTQNTEPPLPQPELNMDYSKLTWVAPMTPPKPFRDPSHGQIPSLQYPYPTSPPSGFGSNQPSLYPSPSPNPDPHPFSNPSPVGTSTAEHYQSYPRSNHPSVPERGQGYGEQTVHAPQYSQPLPMQHPSAGADYSFLNSR